MARSKDAIERRAQKRNKSVGEQRQADSKEMRRQLQKEEEAAKKRKIARKRKIADNHDEMIHQAKDVVPTVTEKNPSEVSPTMISEPAAVTQSRNTSVDEHRKNYTKEIRKDEEVATKRQKIVDKHNNVIQAKDAVLAVTEKCPPLVSSTMTPKAVTAPQSENEIVAAKANTKVSATDGNTFARDPLGEPGAWHCKGCGNKNFPSRSSCHSKTCDEKRPAGVFVPPRYKRPTSSRHDESTSKNQKWPKQADQSTLELNGALRKRYLETGGEGMKEEDVNRAKILIARDERKKDKKKMRSQAKGPVKSQLLTQGN